MFEIKAKISDISFKYAEKLAIISFETENIGDIAEIYDIYHKCDLNVKISKFRKKRSNDANSYAWSLLSKLAAKLRIPKNDIYRDYIREIDNNSETVCVKNEAVEKLCKGWNHNGIGWVTETMPSKIKGCTNVILYYGSSTYDSAQMSRLIDLIVADCKEQNIQTMTPDEILKLKSLWGEE